MIWSQTPLTLTCLSPSIQFAVNVPTPSTNTPVWPGVVRTPILPLTQWSDHNFCWTSKRRIPMPEKSRVGIRNSSMLPTPPRTVQQVASPSNSSHSSVPGFRLLFWIFHSQPENQNRRASPDVSVRLRFLVLRCDSIQVLPTKAPHR